MGQGGVQRYGREVNHGDTSTITYHGRGIEEEEDSRSSRTKGGLLGVFRNNPSLMIVLLDILFIILVLSLVLPFIGRKSESGNFTGLEVSLHGYLFQDVATVSLVVTSLPGAVEEGRKADAELKLRFSLPGDGEEPYAEKELSIVPPPVGESLVVREELSLSEGVEAGEVRADLRREGEKLSLEKELTKRDASVK